ncbi:MAG: hypothetical protein PHC34_11325 [Candidatus Gastranaerophilales bacterium]|nr:hypothetical protein [Candidatus Gastranaerophilales bacterium]
MDKDNKIELTEEDVKLADYIFSILKSQGSIIMSWGFQSPVVIKLGLKFKVNGFLLKGSVEVIYNEGADLFDISFIEVDGTLKNTLVGIYFDQLIEVIDNHVERVDNYIERVNQEYNIINYEEKCI